MSLSSKVLALAWRPHNFSEMIGQEHVLPALINSLDYNRLHHAYLFTGTRGVGKTSVARIFAKCLNCEQGISSKPCNTCSACVAIDNGCFIDLIEVDAASRTKVEDTRELLDNVQYLPSQGRFKIYLIDEVHMLSGHSFNALLKTLEEPPSHVKFLLATTDPQRLPMTVLSRCLQFHLKHISENKLAQHFRHILKTDNVAFEENTLALISRAAKGSVRDGLSLLDQAIAFSQGKVSEQAVKILLGHIGENDIIALVKALQAHDAETLLKTVSHIAEYSSDFDQVLEGLINLLHRIAVFQFVENKEDDSLLTLATTLSKESVQLYYQIALTGLTDLPLAPNPRAGLEMTLLRMLAFEPAKTALTNPVPVMAQSTENKNITPDVSPALANWTNVVNELQLTGMAQVLALNSSVASFDGNTLELLLSERYQPILNRKLEDRLKNALSGYLGKTIVLRITIGASRETPAENRKLQQQATLDNATAVMKSDTYVQTLVDVFDAHVQPGSIQAAHQAQKTTCDE